jgi:regulator of sigma D
VPQLLRNAPDYLILDYLSEGAMSVFARIMQQHPQGGFPADFVTVHIGPHLREIMAKKVSDCEANGISSLHHPGAHGGRGANLVRACLRRS